MPAIWLTEKNCEKSRENKKVDSAGRDNIFRITFQQHYEEKFYREKRIHIN